MTPAERRLVNIGFDAGWDAHAAYVATTPDAVGAECCDGPELCAFSSDVTCSEQARRDGRP